MRPALAGAGARFLTPMIVLATTGWATMVTQPANAEVFRVVNADRPADFLDFDCPQSPDGRDFAWVQRTCRLAATTTTPARKVTVHGWDPVKKEAITKPLED